MKNLIIFLLILSIVSLSGCVSDSPDKLQRTETEMGYRSEFNGEWSVEVLTRGTFIESLNEAKAEAEISDLEIYNETGYSKLEDYGTTQIAGITAYYNTYYLLYEDNTPVKFNGILRFEKNNKWYAINWMDQLGNPNKNEIEQEIAYYINKL
ncbi:hypothetical protein JCM15415_08520 [Methanobacterium movens]